jgi:hypothetical protein
MLKLQNELTTGKRKAPGFNPGLFSFSSLFPFPMREAFIELFQHFRRLLSESYCSDLTSSFALTVRETVVELFQHFQRLLSLCYLPCSLGTIV